MDAHGASAFGVFEYIYAFSGRRVLAFGNWGIGGIFDGFWLYEGREREWRGGKMRDEFTYRMDSRAWAT